MWNWLKRLTVYLFNYRDCKNRACWYNLNGKCVHYYSKWLECKDRGITERETPPHE